MGAAYVGGVCFAWGQCAGMSLEESAPSGQAAAHENRRQQQEGLEGVYVALTEAEAREVHDWARSCMT